MENLTTDQMKDTNGADRGPSRSTWPPKWLAELSPPPVLASTPEGWLKDYLRHPSTVDARSSDKIFAAAAEVGFNESSIGLAYTKLGVQTVFEGDSSQWQLQEYHP
jgi:hypothetical protein